MFARLAPSRWTVATVLGSVVPEAAGGQGSCSLLADVPARNPPVSKSRPNGWEVMLVRVLCHMGEK